LWNEKSQAEALLVSSPMFSSHKYDTNISEDGSRLKKKPFAFAKEMKPIVIETTKAQYKEAAKKALEKFADAFIAKAKAMKK
jgi:hypothetical protein